MHPVSQRSTPAATGRALRRWPAAALALLAFVPVALLPAPLLARQIRFQHLGLEDGLSHSYVTAIVSDRRGFLWFGTQDGLDRYDGYSIRAFRHDLDDARSLSNNFVTKLLVDHAGDLWVGTYGGGLDRFDRRAETFTHYRQDESRPGSLSNDHVHAIFEDSRRNLWVGSDEGGLDRLDRGSDTFVHYRHGDDPRSLAENDVWGIAEDRDGSLWVATFGAGLDRLDPAHGTFEHHAHDPDDPRSLSHDEVWSVFVDSQGRVWAGTYGGGLELYDRAGNGFRHYRHDPKDPSSLGGDVVFELLEDRQGRFWVGTETAGVNLMDRERGTFEHFVNDPFVPTSLSHDSVEAIHQDRSGAIWAGTYNGGVSYFYEPKFEQFGLGPGAAGLANSVVTALIEDRHGEIWIGTDGGGLARFDRAHGAFRHYRHADDDPGSLSNDAVMALLEDRQGNLWIGTYAGGINLFDRASETFHHFRHDERDPRSLIRDDVRAFCEDAAGNLWVGTGLAGVDLMDRRTGTFTHHQHDPADPNSISGDYAQAVLADHEGILWFGTTLAGLDRFDPKSGRMTHFRHRATDPASLGGDHVVSLFEDSRRRLWVGTTEGFDLVDRQHGTFRHYRVKDGLPNDVVNAILEDTGVLWLSTDRGLSRFDPDAGTFRNYDALDGLQGNQFNPQAALRSRRGELYFGGVNGFNVFDPKTLHDNAFVPPVVLTELTINNHPVPIGGQGPLHEAISEARSLTLSHRDAVIGFTFAALSYVGTRKNRYAYRLDGFDDDWQQVGTRRTATYTNLDPGRYVFRVKAANNDGMWNQRGTSLRLVITPPWWLTWWFRGSAGLLLALFAGVVFQARVRAVERRNAELRSHNLELNEEIEERMRVEEALRWSEQQVRRLNEELEARVRSRTVQLEAANEELEAFAYSVSHDLRAPLRHIAGFSEMLLDDHGAAIGEVGRDFVDRIIGSARHMSTLIDGLLLLSRVTRGDMQAARVDLTALAQRVADACQQSYPATAVAIAPGLVTRGDARLLEVALENLLGNAFKFSARVASPRVELGEAAPEASDGHEVPAGQRVYFVRDNGAGFDMAFAGRLFGAFSRLHGAEEFEGTGIGLATVQRIVHRHGGRIWAQGGVGEGATFYFTLE